MNESKISQVMEPACTLRQRKPNPPQRMLVFSSRRLLTERSSVTVIPFALDVETEYLTIRATMPIMIMAGIQGFSRGGLND